MQAAKLPTLAHLSEKIYSYESEDQIINQTVKLVIEELELAGSIIFLKYGEYLEAKSTTSEKLPKCKIQINDKDNYIARTFTESKVFQSKDITKYSSCFEHLKNKYKSGVSIPINASNELIGVILIFKDDQSTSQIEIEILKVLAFIIAAAINDVRNVKALKKKIQLIEKLNDEQKYLLDIIAHELKSPLTVIKANHQLIEKFIQNGKKHSKLLDLVAANNKAIDKQSKILSNLYKFTRDENENKNRNFEHINLFLLIKEIIDNQSKVRSIEQSDDPKLKTVLSLEDIKDEKLFLDYTKMHEILNNLISNAYKYTHEGTVTVKANYDGVKEVLSISIIDTGIGISPEDQNKIWRKFSRIDQRDKSRINVEGTGLGLYIVNKICKLIGAELDLESEQGKGSTFTIIIRNVKREINFD